MGRTTAEILADRGTSAAGPVRFKPFRDPSSAFLGREAVRRPMNDRFGTENVPHLSHQQGWLQTSGDREGPRRASSGEGISAKPAQGER